MKQPTMKEMLAVPVEFRLMTPAELDDAMEKTRTGGRPYSDREIIRAEKHRRQTIAWTKDSIARTWPNAIAEYRKEIERIEKDIVAAEKRVAKLEAQP